MTEVEAVTPGEIRIPVVARVLVSVVATRAPVSIVRLVFTRQRVENDVLVVGGGGGGFLGPVMGSPGHSGPA